MYTSMLGDRKMVTTYNPGTETYSSFRQQSLPCRNFLNAMF